VDRPSRSNLLKSAEPVTVVPMIPDSDEIDRRLATFRVDVTRLSNTQIIDRFFVAGEPICITRAEEVDLQRVLADQFRVQVRDVLMVGSGKLGFTMVTKENRPQFSPFSDESDIDVALISKALFEKYWEAAHSFYDANGAWGRLNGFKKYLFRGWIRPDMLPTSEDFPMFKEWVEFLQSPQASGQFGGYKIAAGIYHSEFFSSQYLGRAIDGCRTAVEGENI
jgi:hypothetical protein